MRRTQSSLTVAKALHQVFVASSEPGSSLPKLSIRPSSLRIRLSAIYSPLPTTRAYANAQQTPRRAARDEEIRAREVQIVNENGKLNLPARLDSILRSLDRKTSFLVQVAPSEPDKPPICKIIGKEELRQTERLKAKPNKNPSTIVKQLELNWAIDSNDLNHRMNKMEEFLNQGRRVEILLAAKRKGRKATMDQAEAVVKRIREKVKGLESAKESKEMEGKILGQATLYFEGKEKK
ncbi:MAG: hypothetical protein M1827_001435 [Pycnora praestabilis]|nr:MAG: hypothetical protein M1827_001435 [Pycnora praestabilis]